MLEYVIALAIQKSGMSEKNENILLQIGFSSTIFVYIVSWKFKKDFGVFTNKFGWNFKCVVIN